MRARVLGLALAGLLLSGAQALAAELRVSAYLANVREGPSRSSPILATVNRGAVLELIDRRGSWYRVRLPASGLEGYVHSSLIATTGAPTSAPAGGEIEVNGFQANVRSGPGRSGSVLATVGRGTRFEVVGRTGPWYRVRSPASGLEGYVHASLVQPVPAAARPAPFPPPSARPVARPAPAPPAEEPEVEPSPPPRPFRPAPPPDFPPAPPPVEPAPEEPRIGVRGFAQGGLSFFRAEQSFRAVFGEAKAPTFGGGAEGRYRRFFLQVNVERVKKTGERAFVFEGEVFPLGIEDTVTLTPVSFLVGYRFLSLGRLTLLGGAGVGFYQLKEQWAFADSEETVSERFTSYHALVGAEYAVTRWVAVRAEVHYAAVPDALGVGGVSELFGETDLGGPSVRIKVLAGR